MHSILLIAIALASGSGNAQAIIDTCKRTSSQADRIACLEAAILMRDASAGGSPESEPEAEPGDAAAAPAAAKPPRAAPVPEQPVPAEPAATPEQPRREPAPTPTATAQQQPGQAEQREAAGIGAEQVEARAETGSGQAKPLDEARDLRVASYGKLPYDKIQVNLENGQVWRQLRSDRQRIRVDLERNQTVDIEESSLGGYRLRLNEMRRIIRVERIR